jgi:hypothetical protein
MASSSMFPSTNELIEARTAARAANWKLENKQQSLKLFPPLTYQEVTHLPLLHCPN